MCAKTWDAGCEELLSTLNLPSLSNHMQALSQTVHGIQDFIITFVFHQVSDFYQTVWRLQDVCQRITFLGSYCTISMSKEQIFVYVWPT